MWWLSSKLLQNKHFGHIAGKLACLAMSAVRCELTSPQGKVCLNCRLQFGDINGVFEDWFENPKSS